jgi:urease accessory protein
MFDATSRSEGIEREGSASLPDDATRLSPVRARGRVALAFAPGPRGTFAKHIVEAENYRVRMPVVAGRCEAVLMNTGGGMAGGDALAVDIELAAGTEAVVTTQAAERVYRSLAPDTTVDVTLSLGAGARLAWLPQETILYSGARLRRTMTAGLEGDASLLLAEIVVFGRRAMGERLGCGLFVDNWRIARGGRLAFAESVRLDGELGDVLNRPCIAGGAGAVATLLYMAPDAEDRLEAIRAALGEDRSDRDSSLPLDGDGGAKHGATAAASAWNGHLVVRALAPDSGGARAAVAAVARVLMGEGLPRVWGT